ncbi:MAG TPA: nucleoside recognition domain-containing protein, partial [Lachnospiraceae bacterium]|nr:nucleoside recognition domain-containing protein [Lachnospiraceae bacterium]
MKHLSKTKDRSTSGRIYVKLLLFILLLTMITNPIASLTGAKTGLLLWFNTVLPTLLPFIILSNLIIRFQVTDYICKVFSPIFTRLFRISNAGCYPLVIGILSGYPMGAKTCNDLLKEKQLSSKEGQFLMILGNNASYMFITSFIAVSSLSLPEHKYEIAAIIYLSSIISATIYRFNCRYSLKHFLVRLFFHRKVSEVTTFSTILDDTNIKTDPTLRTDQPLSFSTVDNCILDGFVVITKIGGYIILFSVIAQISSILLSH